MLLMIFCMDGPMVLLTIKPSFNIFFAFLFFYLGRQTANNATTGDQKQACIGVKDPVTSPPKLARPIYKNDTDATYTLKTSLSACMFWSEINKDWETTGCKVK